jgi:hypothetical protein
MFHFIPVDVYLCIAMDHYYGLDVMISTKLFFACQHIFRLTDATRDYCSLVDSRWRDFIHWIRAVSA